MEGANWNTEERFITHPAQFPVRLFLIGLQVSDLVMQSVIFFLYTLEFLFLLFCLAFSSLPVGVRYYMPSLCMLYAVFIAYGMFKSVRLKKRLRFSVSPINLNCMWLQAFSSLPVGVRYYMPSLCMKVNRALRHTFMFKSVGLKKG